MRESLARRSEREKRAILSVQRGRRHRTEVTTESVPLRSRGSLRATRFSRRDGSRSNPGFGLLGARSMTNVAYVVVDAVGMRMRIIREKRTTHLETNENVFPVKSPDRKSVV